MLVWIKINFKLQYLISLYTGIFCSIIMFSYDNSTESSDTWILRYTENKNILLASHFEPYYIIPAQILQISFPKSIYISEKRKESYFFIPVSVIDMVSWRKWHCNLVIFEDFWIFEILCRVFPPVHIEFSPAYASS